MRLVTEMRHRIFVVLLLAVFIAVQSGCLFEPRQAEQPGGGEETPWIVPNTSDDVFSNLKSGFEASSNSNYERSLDESFTFKPRPEDETQLPAGVFDGWTKTVELEVVTRLKGEYPGKRTIRFGAEGADRWQRRDEKQGIAIYEGEYMIEINSGNGVQSYAGIARFTVVQTSLGWMLKEWEDLDVNGNFPTSGYLRGTLRSSG